MSLFRKSEHQMSVEAFMLRASQEIPVRPVVTVSDSIRLLRAKLILEEALETIQHGLGVGIFLCCKKEQFARLSYEDIEFSTDKPVSVVDVIDGCCDIAVVATGTLSVFGVPDLVFQDMVNQNNLDKFKPGHYFREDGKLMKPPGHKDPDIAGALKEML